MSDKDSNNNKKKKPLVPTPTPRPGVQLWVLAGLLVYRHRENIDKLVKGTESRLGGTPGGR